MTTVKMLIVIMVSLIAHGHVEHGHDGGGQSRQGDDVALADAFAPVEAFVLPRRASRQPKIGFSALSGAGQGAAELVPRVDLDNSRRLAAHMFPAT